MRSTKNYLWRWVGMTLILTVAVGCERTSETPQTTNDAAAAGDAAGTANLPVTTAELMPIEVGATTPAHQFGSIYLAGQPAADDLAKWKEQGVRTVVNLRMPGETDWDEGAAVEALGMRYVSVPFRGPGTLDDEKISEALEVLADQERQPVLLHCASANRVGAIWYAHRIQHDGVNPVEALAEAKTIGLRTNGFVAVVDEYCERAAN